MPRKTDPETTRLLRRGLGCKSAAASLASRASWGCRTCAMGRGAPNNARRAWQLARASRRSGTLQGSSPPLVRASAGAGVVRDNNSRDRDWMAHPCVILACRARMWCTMRSVRGSWRWARRPRSRARSRSTATQMPRAPGLAPPGGTRRPRVGDPTRPAPARRCFRAARCKDECVCKHCECADLQDETLSLTELFAL